MPGRKLPRALLVIASGAAVLAAGAVLAPLERAIDDARARLRPDAGWPADLAVVRIDEASIAGHGALPWGPESMQPLLDALERAGARTIAIDAVLPQPPDEASAERLASALDRTVLAVPWLAPRGALRAEDAALLDPSLLAVDVGGPRHAAAGFVLPPVRYASAALALGHAIATTDPDGLVRRTRPLVAVEGTRGALPSAPFAAWLHHREIAPGALTATPAGILLPDGSSLPDPLELDLRGSPARSISAASLLRGEPADLRGALAIVCVDAASAPDRARTVLGETKGCDLFAAAVRTLDRRSWPRRVPAVPAVLALAAIALFVTRRWHLAALAAAWAGAAVALVPLADVHLPLLAPLAFAAIAAFLPAEDPP